MRNRSLLVAAAVFSTVIAFAPPARADWVWVPRHPYNPYARRHFYMGIEGVGAVVLAQSGPRAFLRDGGGFGLFLGGRLSRWFALEFTWQPTFHSSTQDDLLAIGQPADARLLLNALTVDGKVFFAHGRVQPFFMFGLGGYFLGDNVSIFGSGPGYQLGGGVDFWLDPHISIGVKLLYRGIDLIDYDARNDDTYISMFTAAVDFTGRF